LLCHPALGSPKLEPNRVGFVIHCGPHFKIILHGGPTR
jgi:hypothetical protein